MTAVHRPALRRLLVLGATCAAVATVACAGDGDADAACGPVRREPLDARSFHVLPGADAPEFRTDPPTSGPHVAAPEPEPVADEPIPPVVQVGILEEGGVLIQHVDLSDADREAVEALAGDGVVVAPAESLPEGAAVIATAWVTKQVCTSVDVGDLGAFAAEHVDRGPDGHGS